MNVSRRPACAAVPLISVIAAARALALIRGRDYVIVNDIEALVRDAFRHRIVLSYQALAEDERREGVFKAFPQDFFDLVIVDEGHNLKHGFSSHASARNRVVGLAFGHPGGAGAGRVDAPVGTCRGARDG